MESNSFRIGSFGRVTRACVLQISVAVVFAANPIAAAMNDLTEMSLEDLMNVEVTSVSKKAQAKTSAASAITVITAEDIRRGGFTQIPEALRTVPGVAVARVDASSWAISIRGNAGLFANKLLVMIDGRTVYTPIFGGTFWDAQDYPIEDVERIEVIRGPGGTLWGANAVNGVINIITKDAAKTQGALLSGYGGSTEHGVTARFGGEADIGQETHYRVYARGTGVDDYDVDQSGDGHDAWQAGRLGFRSDSKLTDVDTLRVSGDFYHEANEEAALNPATPFVPPTFLDVDYKQTGGNVLVDWDRVLGDTSRLQAKAFYSRDDGEFLIRSNQDMVDLELQHNFNAMDNVAVTWGTNYRFTTVHFRGSSAGIPLSFSPNDEDVHIASGFGQVQVDLFDDKLALIVGTKLGYYSWSGFEYQPSGRLIYTPTNGHAIWGAVSRAVRTPTEAERDVSLTLPLDLGPPVTPPMTLSGDRGTRSEELLAFELGYRFFALERINAEVTLFWNEYESRSNFNRTSPLPPPPLTGKFSNQAKSTNRGVELEVNILPTNWWRVRMAYSYLNIDDDPSNSPTSLPFGKEKHDNPVNLFNVESFFDLPMGFEFDVSVYYVDGLPGTVPSRLLVNDNVQEYVRLDLRLGYKPVEWLELSLVGQNLTDRRHYESTDFTGGQSTQVPRGGYAKATLRF